MSSKDKFITIVTIALVIQILFSVITGTVNDIDIVIRVIVSTMSGYLVSNNFVTENKNLREKTLIIIAALALICLLIIRNLNLNLQHTNVNIKALSDLLMTIIGASVGSIGKSDKSGTD